MAKRYAFRRTIIGGMCAGIVLAILLVVAPTRTPLNAFVPPPGLAAAVIKAIPAITGLLTKKPSNKKNDESGQALKSVQDYAQREQISWRIVSASGLATQHMAAMQQIISATKAPDKDSMSDLNNHWTFVDDGIAAIVESKPKTQVFDSSSTMVIAINKLLLNGTSLRKNIKMQLKYDPDKPDARMLENLKENIKTLDEILEALNDSTGAEIEMIADELAVLGTNPASASDGTATKAAGKKVSQSAFEKPEALDKSVGDLRQQLSNYTSSTVAVQ
ncbi:MAG TPA: hypothetical protein VIH76_01415 [Candidatus Acidoferrales bacterium]